MRVFHKYAREISNNTCMRVFANNVREMSNNACMRVVADDDRELLAQKCVDYISFLNILINLQTISNTARKILA